MYEYTVTFMEDEDLQEHTLSGLVAAETLSEAADKVGHFVGEDNIISCSFRNFNFFDCENILLYAKQDFSLKDHLDLV